MANKIGNPSEGRAGKRKDRNKRVWVFCRCHKAA